MTIFKQYKRKPVIVEAIHWVAPDHASGIQLGRDIVAEITASGHFAELVRPIYDDPYIAIKTLEGIMQAHPGSYICRGLKGEYWPVKQDIFERTNELIEGES